MKLKKIISSLLVAAMAISMSVVSFADDETKYLYFGQAEYVEGQNVTVDFYLHEDVVKVGGMGQLVITYSPDAYKFVSGSTVVSTAAVTEYEDGIAMYLDEDAAEKSIADPTAPFITMEFEVEDPAKIGEAPFMAVIEDGYTVFNIFVGETRIALLDSSAQKYAADMTVTKKAPVTPEPPVDPEPEEPEVQEPAPGTVGEKDGYTTVVDDDKATRFVVTDTKASIAATAASVLKVTYAGETRQANLYKLLGVEAGATGDVTIGSLTIKMVLPATVQDAASIGAYSFIVE